MAMQCRCGWLVSILLILAVAGVSALRHGDSTRTRLSLHLFQSGFVQIAGHIWFVAEQFVNDLHSDLAAGVIRAGEKLCGNSARSAGLAGTTLRVAEVSIELGRADDEQPPQQAKSAQALFERLKRLAGQWTGKAPHDTGQQEGTVIYKVTSAGNTVMETMFPGTGNEMVTMYTLDGDSIVLTHYCAIGNQPRMKCTATSDLKNLVFRFLDGTNLDPAKDMHMHEATLELVDDNHLRSTWTLWSGGKADHTTTFDLQRKK